MKELLFTLSQKADLIWIEHIGVNPKRKRIKLLKIFKRLWIILFINDKLLIFIVVHFKFVQSL